MVSVMLVLLFFSIIQVCLWIYTRTLLTSAAGEIARYNGLANASAFDVTARVGTELGDGMGAGTRSTLRCTQGGTDLVTEIRCIVTAPGLVGLLDGVLPDVTAVGHAAREGIS